MSWNIELSLNTDYHRFESWLDRYRLKTTPFIVNLEGHKTLHVTSAPTFDRAYQGFRYHKIDASIGKPSPTDPERLELSWHFPVIELELFEPSNNRINAKIECKHNALYSYYLDLLAAITKLYPEAGQTVLDYLSRLNPDSEVKSEQPTTINSSAAHLPLAGLAGDSKTWQANPIRLNHTTGNFQPGLYPPETKDAILKVTSETLAGLSGIADTQTVQPVGAAKPKKPNAQINQRAMIWRSLTGWMKLQQVTPTPKECIAQLKKTRAYKDKKISPKRMQTILNEGFAGAYENILKNV